MVGQSQKLNVNKAIKHYKASGLDLSTILYKPEKAKTVPNHNTTTRSWIRKCFDFKLSKETIPSIYRKENKSYFKIKIQIDLWVLF
jgi:glutamate synthase (ferredoxin)